MSPLVLALLAGTVSAQTTDRPILQVGDQWHFAQYWGMRSTEPNRVWMIHSVASTAIEGTENGEPLMLTPDLGVLESPRTRDSNPQSLGFPLEVGKRWRYTTEWVFKAKGSKGSAVIDVAVVGHDRLKIPAGEFDAFKLPTPSATRTSSVSTRPPR